MLTVESIIKTYEQAPLLRGVSFGVAAGETVCLLGPSGSGKTTLLRIIAGLEPAEAGRVLWQGQDLVGVPVHKRGFGLMFQDYALFPHRSVAENVAFGLRMQGSARTEIERQVKDTLEQVNLAGFEQRRVTDLSGGEQQRVALARTLASRPRLLMLDEPLGALDHNLREELSAELRGVLRATGIPAIYVTHDQEEAFAIGDRLILLHEGRVEQSGAPQQVYQAPASLWAAQFLGMTNLLGGEVVSVAPLRVRTRLGEFSAMAPASELRHGEQVTLLFRPMAARHCGRETSNRLTGSVVDCLFRGGLFQVRLRLAFQQEFTFFIDHFKTPGEEVTLPMPEEDILCYQKEAWRG